MHNEHGHETREEHSGTYLDGIIRGRRSIRKYKDHAVPWGMVIDILNSAKYAPFAGNVMNMKLIVIKNEDKRRAISEACSQQHWMANAPIHIVVVAEPEKAQRYYGTRGVRLYSIQSIGAAIENMLLTAHSLGLGTCWVGAFDQEDIRLICNMPEHLEIHAVVTIGYADEQPPLPPKYRIEHMMFFEKWWGRIEGPRNGIGMWSPAIQKGVNATKKMIHEATENIKEKFSKKEEEESEPQGKEYYKSQTEDDHKHH